MWAQKFKGILVIGGRHSGHQIRLARLFCRQINYMKLHHLFFPSFFFLIFLQQSKCCSSESKINQNLPSCLDHSNTEQKLSNFSFPGANVSEFNNLSLAEEFMMLLQKLLVLLL